MNNMVMCWLKDAAMSELSTQITISRDSFEIPALDTHFYSQIFFVWHSDPDEKYSIEPLCKIVLFLTTPVKQCLVRLTRAVTGFRCFTCSLSTPSHVNQIYGSPVANQCCDSMSRRLLLTV